MGTTSSAPPGSGTLPAPSRPRLPASPSSLPASLRLRGRGEAWVRRDPRAPSPASPPSRPSPSGHRQASAPPPGPPAASPARTPGAALPPRPPGRTPPGPRPGPSAPRPAPPGMRPDRGGGAGTGACRAGSQAGGRRSPRRGLGFFSQESGAPAGSVKPPTQWLYLRAAC